MFNANCELVQPSFKLSKKKYLKKIPEYVYIMRILGFPHLTTLFATLFRLLGTPVLFFGSICEWVTKTSRCYPRAGYQTLEI